jgi:hypothetical protein
MRGRRRHAGLAPKDQVPVSVSCPPNVCGSPAAALRQFRGRRVQPRDTHSAPLLLLATSRLVAGNVRTAAQEESVCDSTTNSTATTAESIST